VLAAKEGRCERENGQEKRRTRMPGGGGLGAQRQKPVQVWRPTKGSTKVNGFLEH